MTLVLTENQAGKPVQINDFHLIPIEKSTRIQPPGMWGALIWRRPSAVVIQHSDGSQKVIEIQDTTRQAQLTLLGIGLLGSFLIWFFNRDRKRTSSRR